MDWLARIYYPNIYEDEYLIIESKFEVKLFRKEIINLKPNSFQTVCIGLRESIRISKVYHPAAILDREAFSPKDTFILNDYNLKAFVNNIRDFFIKFSEREAVKWDKRHSRGIKK
jgi:hypothetical protein